MVGVQTAHYQSYYIDEIKLFVDFFFCSILSIFLKDKLPSLWGEGEQLKEYVLCVAVLSFLLVFLFPYASELNWESLSDSDMMVWGVSHVPTEFVKE